MAGMGQSRRFGRTSDASGPPLTADIWADAGIRRCGPIPDTTADHRGRVRRPLLTVSVGWRNDPLSQRICPCFVVLRPSGELQHREPPPARSTFLNLHVSQRLSRTKKSRRPFSVVGPPIHLLPAEPFSRRSSARSKIELPLNPDACK